MTNLDLLHKTISENSTARQSGKTRRLIHTIIGEIQVAVSDTILLQIRFKDIGWFKKELKDAIEGQGVEIIEECFNEVDFLNQDGRKVVLKFISVSCPKEQLVGYKNAAIYELDY